MDDEPNVLLWIVSGGITALLIWVYCGTHYGFLGFALGWMPAGIIGAIVGLLIMLFWRAILSVALLAALAVALYLHLHR